MKSEKIFSFFKGKKISPMTLEGVYKRGEGEIM